VAIDPLPDMLQLSHHDVTKVVKKPLAFSF
jgi:hypothetical protein